MEEADKWTSIRVHKSLKKDLRTLGQKGDTYEEIIRWMTQQIRNLE